RRGSRVGTLVQGAGVVESTRRVDTVVLDKTGTVTTGRMALVDVVPARGVEVEQALRLAGSVEDASEHPIARAIVERARARGVELAAVDRFAATEGRGVHGVVDGHAVAVGRERCLAGRGCAPGPERAAAQAAAVAAGRTPVLVGWGGEARAVRVV